MTVWFPKLMAPFTNIRVSVPLFFNRINSVSSVPVVIELTYMSYAGTSGMSTYTFCLSLTLMSVFVVSGKVRVGTFKPVGASGTLSHDTAPLLRLIILVVFWSTLLAIHQLPANVELLSFAIVNDVARTGPVVNCAPLPTLTVVPAKIGPPRVTWSPISMLFAEPLQPDLSEITSLRPILRYS